MIKFLLKKRRIILFIIIPALILGLFSISVLPVKLYPNMRKPRINVNIPHPGLTAEDFFNDYSKTIEERLNSIRDIDLIESQYGNNRTYIMVEFDWKINSEDAKTRVLNEMNSIKSDLPEEAQDFTVGYWTGERGFLSIAVTSETIESSRLYQIVDTILRPKFVNVKDAEEVNLYDVDDLTAEIILKPEAVLNYGLTIDKVAEVIKSGYKNISVGYFNNIKKEQYNVRIKRNIDDIFSIEKIIVDTIGNKIIYLKDIADVNITHALPRRVYRANGKSSVLVYASPKEDGNIKNMSDDIAKIIRESKSELPEDINFNFIIDPGLFINNAIRNVVTSGLQGAFLAIFIILLLLGEIKNTIIISISIPTSIILSFILMYMFKVSLNLISLGGMALAVGMIVDSAVVVIENIHRHRLEALKLKKKLNFIDTIINSVKEVTNAVIASTLTTVCVFFPISFTSPLTNAILGDIARTVIYTLMCSMFVALIVIPVITFYLFRKEYAEKKARELTKLQKFSIAMTEKIKDGYIFLLQKMLYSKKLSIIFITSSFGFLILLIIFVLPLIKKEIIAQPISNRIAISFTHFGSSDKEEMMNNIEPVEKEIRTKYKDRLINIFTTLTRDNTGNIVLTFKNSFGIKKILDELKIKYSSNPEWRYDVYPWDPSSLPLPRTDDLHIRVYGPDKKQIVSLMEEIVDLINKEKIFRNVHAEPTTRTQEEIILVPRFETIAQFSEYPLSKLTGISSIALNGKKVITMKQYNKDLDIYMKYDENFINKSEDLENYLIPVNNKAIPIKHFFDFIRQRSIPEIRTDNGEETYNIYGSMMRDESKSKRTLYEERIKKMLKEKLKVPEGYSVQFQDTQKIINESVKSLLIALAASIFLIYIVCGIQFNSIKIPLIILVTIPLGFIGVIISLFVFNSTVSLNSMLGTILLGGIVVNNAIVIIDFYINEKRQKLSSTELILKVARLRFLPIIMTTTTTILGMLPIAVAIGDGANILQPLGISISCGLGFSTFFTLFMIPCIMNFIDLTPQHKKEEV